MPAFPHFRPGDMLPGTRYRVIKELGSGGMGVVYQVVKPPQIQGVLKLMSLELTEHDEFRARFFDEVRILSQLEHPNIVRVFDYDVLEDGALFYVMEVLSGRTVRDVIASVGRVTPRVAFEITRQLLEALHCAHTHDVPVVHRDIKPENIFLHSPKHGEPVVKLIDFGVIAVADRQHDGTFVGTWKYAAPEQIRGEPASPATDLYAVGLVLYEMLAGVGAYDHMRTGDLIGQADVREPPPPLARVAPWVPPSIVALIDSALARDPRARPKSAYAFSERLLELEWANDGNDPRDPTNVGPPPPAPLSRMLTDVGAKRPSSKNLAAAAPASDRLGDVPLIGVPPSSLHHGPTLKGVGERYLPTSPGEDALLAGLDARGDQRLETPRPGQVIIRPSGADLVEVDSSPDLEKAARASRSGEGPASDTRATEDSGTRPAGHKSSRWILAFALAAIFLVGVGILLTRRATTVPAPSAVLTTAVIAPERAIAPSRDVPPSATPMPSDATAKPRPKVTVPRAPHSSTAPPAPPTSTAPRASTDPSYVRGL